MDPTDNRKEQFINSLPKDGSPQGNISLMRELGWTTDIYWKIHGILLEEGKIIQGRGKGGSVLLTYPTAETGRKNGKEKDLYIPVKETLEANYVKQQNFTSHILKVTANSGKRNCGQWNRPDLLLAGFLKYELVIPRMEFRVVTFEIKPKICNRLQAVYETASHSRRAHMSYLVMQVDEHDELQRESSECERFGVGLISFIDPKDYKTYNFAVDPQPGLVDAGETDTFLLALLGSEERKAIQNWACQLV